MRMEELGRFSVPEAKKVLAALEKAGIPCEAAADDSAFHTRTETLEHLFGMRGGLARCVVVSIPGECVEAAQALVAAALGLVV